ncbi:MAG: 4-demethylwyosine synthase TYW1 [Nanoarchaeota archaeon]
MPSEKVIKELEHQQYKIVGNHSAVKTCHWLRMSMRDQGVCYKQKFYGIQSHRCLQMTPWAFGCTNECMYCWRIMEKASSETKRIDDPEEILKGCIEAQRTLLTGFGGWEGTNKIKLKEAKDPKQVAISLIGEPTMYPKISDFISLCNSRKMTTFLVTNGQLPERLEGMTEPTNLYISLDAPDKETYKKIDRPMLPDFWERLNKSLELMNSFSCTKVLRLTLVKDWNMKNIEGYAKLIKIANPDFIECKGYMHVGESQKRLPRDAMPLHNEVKAFSEQLSKHGYSYKDEQEASRVVLLRG